MVIDDTHTFYWWMANALNGLKSRSHSYAAAISSLGNGVVYSGKMASSGVIRLVNDVHEGYALTKAFFVNGS